MKSKLDRIISVATLAALVAIFVVLRKPAAVVQSQTPAPAANAQSIERKMNQAEPAAQPSQGSGGTYQQYQPSQASSAPQPVTSSGATTTKEGHSSSDGIGAAISQMLGATAGSGAAGLNPESNVGEGAPNIKDQKVTYEGDMVHGQFLTEIGGKDVWVTISGHMGEKDGYATFDPTEFKVGDTNVPVSLVNPMLQRKLAEERDRLKVSSPGGGQ
jgi:hypothetical protein